MDNGFFIGRVRGIDIRANWSVLIVAGLVAWSLADGLLPEFAEGYSTGEYWVAFPMDGGRIYQAWLWARSGDEAEATCRAAAVGHAIGGVLVVLGILEFLFAGAIGGVWLALIGWFVREAANAEVQRTVVEGPLRAVRVSEIMSTDPERVLAGGSVDSFVSEMVWGGRHAAYPVVRAEGDVVGLISLKAVRALDRESWASTTVEAVATPLDRVPAVAPTMSVADLIADMDIGGEGRAPVIDGEELIGIVSPSDVARLVTAVELAGSGPPAQPSDTPSPC